jgi:hypothetical protein
MKLPHCLALTVVCACGGSAGDGGSSQAGQDSVAAADAPALEDAPAPEDAQPAGEDTSEPALPEPPRNPVAVKNGTYDGQTGDDKARVAVTDGKVFVLDAQFTCLGKGGGCKYMSEQFNLTCNKSFEKGLTGLIADNRFEIALNATDKLQGVLLDEQTLVLLASLDPGYCCKGKALVTASWTNESDCAGAEIPDCDPFTGSGCLDNQHCVFDDDDKPTCILSGGKKTGEECNAPWDCEAGTCLNLAEYGKPMCFEYCKPKSNCTTKQCIGIQGTTVWGVCPVQGDYVKCNLLAQDCEDPAQACYYSSLAGYPVCLIAGLATEGECAKPNDCAKGYDCFQNGKCYKLCDQGGGEPRCLSEFANCANHWPPQNAGLCQE